MSSSSFLDYLCLVLVSHLICILSGQLVKRGTSLILTLHSAIYMLGTRGETALSLYGLEDELADTVWFSFYVYFIRAF